MTINQNGLFVEPGQGRSYYLGQDLYTFKAIGEETGEAYTLSEVIVAPGGGAPTHRHNGLNESFYVQDGEIEFQLDDRTFVATAGTFLHSPKGQLHRFTALLNTGRNSRFSNSYKSWDGEFCNFKRKVDS